MGAKRQNNRNELHRIRRLLEEAIKSDLDRMGILYKISSRIKNDVSLRKKIESKGQNHYSEIGKKVTDFIGIRVMTYFISDAEIFFDYFKGKEECRRDDISDNKKELGVDKFKPVRKNLIMDIPQSHKEKLKEILKNIATSNNDYNLIDAAYELQFRTVFSEGWHEVEHLLRYKNQSDWEAFNTENRMLNSIYAALESHDMALDILFNELAHRHYMKGNLQAMMKMKYRLNFKDEDMSEEILSLLNGQHELAKLIHEYDRNEFMTGIANGKYKFKDNEITLDHTACLIVSIDHRLENPKAAKLSERNLKIVEKYIPSK